MMHWLNMGGYWPFVWPCYLLSAATIALNVYFARRDFSAALSEARRRMQSKGTDS